MADGAPDGLAESRELVRGAAKWFVAGLGAIGVVLVAGSQLSSIGSLSVHTARFYVALAGVTLGLLAILWAMWRVVDVLSPRQWAFEDLVAEWDAAGDGAAPRGRPDHAPVGRYFRAHKLFLGGYESPRAIQDLWEVSPAGRAGFDDLVDLMDDLLDKAATIDLQHRFRRLRFQIAMGVLLGAAGILGFAWAANPGDLDDAPPSLRNASLVGVDLHGASLRNVDLTGADLAGADLTGTDLAGAVLTDVTWEDTTCPDGTNSDARGTRAADGSVTGGTCIGHLVP